MSIIFRDKVPIVEYHETGTGYYIFYCNPNPSTAIYVVDIMSLEYVYIHDPTDGEFTIEMFLEQYHLTDRPGGKLVRSLFEKFFKHLAEAREREGVE